MSLCPCLYYVQIRNKTLGKFIFPPFCAALSQSKPTPLGPTHPAGLRTSWWLMVFGFHPSLTLHSCHENNTWLTAEQKHTTCGYGSSQAVFICGCTNMASPLHVLWSAQMTHLRGSARGHHHFPLICESSERLRLHWALLFINSTQKALAVLCT